MNRTFTLAGEIESVGMARVECHPSISAHLMLGRDDAVALRTYLSAPDAAISRAPVFYDDLNDDLYYLSIQDDAATVSKYFV